MKSLFKKLIGFFVALAGFDEENQEKPELLPSFENQSEISTPAPAQHHANRMVRLLSDKKLVFLSRRKPGRGLVAKVLHYDTNTDEFVVRRGGQTFRIGMWEKAAA